MKKVLSFVLALVLMLSVFPMVSITAEGDAIGKIEGVTLNIGSSLTLDYYATFTNVEAENVTMRFTSAENKTTEVQGDYDTKLGMYKFSYTGINPQCMADVIKAELLSGETVLATKDDYSVKAYCDNLIKRSDLGYTTQQLSAFRTLMADMLVYGSAAQEYKTYNIENLADASAWVKYFVSTFAKPVGVREVEGNKDAENKVTSVGLNMANVNRIYFKFVADGAIVKVNGEEVDLSTLKKSGGAYMLYTKDIKATQFDDVYTFTIEKDDTVVSTVRYNVNAYIATMYNKGEADDLIKALYNYGASAEKFLKAKEAQENGGDFDLEEEDTLDSPTTILPESASTYESAVTVEDTGWSASLSGNTTIELAEDDYGQCVHFVRDTSQNYYTPTFHIEKYISQPGYYTVTFNYKVEGATEGSSPFRVILRTAKGTTFSNNSSGSYFAVLNEKVPTAVNGQWETMTVSFLVEEADLKNTASTPWKLCMDKFQENAVTDIYIDNLVVTVETYEFEAEANVINAAETWVSNELVLLSDKKYDSPFNDVTVDLVLRHEDGTEIEVPGFWDGGNIWRVRFACPKTGQWTYRTVCNDESNQGLHGVENTLICTEYSGDLDIYKHGFIKTETGTRYFMYADDTPFFYLGDTHWALGNETIDMVNTIVDKRVEQGYTVYQSQPIGATFTYHNGIDTRDIALMQEYDEKFKIIADAGLVHANAQFFFASDISRLIYANGGYSKELCSTTITKGGTEYKFKDISDTAKAYLEKICRYWVARYSSYPVMWTLGQEVDNDFYWMEESGDTGWSYVNNPFRYVAEYLNMYDPYKSPLSAHQEAHGTTAATDSYPAVDGTNGAVDITTLNLRFNIRGGLTAGNSIIVETANNTEVANITKGASDKSTGKTVVKNVVQGLKLEITEDFDSGFAYFIMTGGLTVDMVANNNVTSSVVLYNPSSEDITVRAHYMKPDWTETGNAVTASIPAGKMKVVKLDIPCNADGTYDSTTSVTDLQLRIDIRSGLNAGNAIVIANENGAEVPSVISASGKGNTTGKIAVTNINDSTPVGVKFNITETFTNNAIAYYYTNGCLTGDMAVYDDAKGTTKSITKTFVIHNPSSSEVTVEVAYYDGWTKASKLTQTETIPAGESETFTIRIDLGTISSAFRGVTAHTWYANQWKPNVNGTAVAKVTNVAKDYWYNGQGKPVVNYEADYCGLYTKDFGARAQGWFAYLSGMFGHGYGAQDTWCYLSPFNENRDDSDGVDTITSAEKQAATWETALKSKAEGGYDSDDQLGYMKKFFTETVGDWYNLIPRFDDKAYLTRETKTYRGVSSSDTGTAYAYIASKEDSSKVVVYFYNFSDTSLAQRPNAKTGWSGIDGSYDFGTLTGTLGNLEANTTYNYMWFNPVTGQVDETGTLTADSNGKLVIPAKTTGDMVFYLYK